MTSPVTRTRTGGPATTSTEARWAGTFAMRPCWVSVSVRSVPSSSTQASRPGTPLELSPHRTTHSSKPPSQPRPPPSDSSTCLG